MVGSGSRLNDFGGPGFACVVQLMIFPCFLTIDLANTPDSWPRFAMILARMPLCSSKVYDL